MAAASSITPGVVLKTRFIVGDKTKFESYIDYVDRNDAKQNKDVEKKDFSLYQDYMANPEKSSSLFNHSSDRLNEEEKKELKETFKNAQKNNSVLWQDVISFDNTWLKEHGVYDYKTKTLDEKKIMDATRDAMKEMLKREGMMNSAVWSAAIHYNTDNIHVHVATVEPTPTRSRGKRKPKTLDGMKSKVVNSIMDRSKQHEQINELIRKNMVANKKNNSMMQWKNRQFKKQFLEIYKNLPNDRREWQYGYNSIDPVRPALDKLSRDYIEKNHKNDYALFLKKLDKEVDVLKRTYGDGPIERKRYENYKQNKIDELYKRMGNAFLSEMREYDKEIKRKENEKMKSNLYKRGHAFQNSLSILYSMRKIEKSFGKEYESWKNEKAYEQLQKKIEEEREWG